MSGKVNAISEQVLTNQEQVSVEWLTAVPTHSDTLTQGTVTAVAVDTRRGTWSENRRHYPSKKGKVS